MIYRSKAGTLAAVRRLFELDKRKLPQGSKLWAERLENVDIRPEGGAIHCRVGLEAAYQSTVTREIADVTAVTLQEDAAYLPDALPTVTLVRTDTSDLWELAKRYHSSVEGIRTLNGEALGSGLLLIPREA